MWLSDFTQVDMFQRVDNNACFIVYDETAVTVKIINEKSSMLPTLFNICTQLILML